MNIKTITSAGIIIITVLAMIPISAFPLVLFQSQAGNMAIIIGLGSILFFALKWKREGVLALLSSSLLCTMIFTSINLSTHERGRSNFSVGHYNVLMFNNDQEKIIESALNSGADVLSFQEVNHRWYYGLHNALQNEYPYEIEYYRNSSPSGMAVFSKIPLKDPEKFLLANKPNIRATVEINSQNILLYFVHTASPTSSYRFKKRNEHLDHLAKRLNDWHNPVIVVGDLNAVPWDTKIKKLKSAGDLQDSRRGYEATYPTWSPVGRIPIDYILYSNDINCTGFQRITETSSDHFGIKSYFNIQYPSQTAEK